MCIYNPFMSCDPGYKKLIINEQNPSLDICQLEREKSWAGWKQYPGIKHYEF